MRRFRLHAFGFIMYLVLALLKVALVNFYIKRIYDDEQDNDNKKKMFYTAIN